MLKRNWKVIGLGSLSLILVLVLLLSGLQIKSFEPPKYKLVNGIPTITVGDPFSISTIEASTPDYTGVTSTIVQQALNALPATGGVIQLISPTYTFTATVSRAIPNVTIKGMNGTTVNYNATSAVFSAGSQVGWVFEDFKTDAGGVTCAADTVVRNVNGKTPTGRTSAYVLATSDATALEKAQADDILSGAADDVKINAALLTYLNVTVVGSTIHSNGTIKVGINAAGNAVVNNISLTLPSASYIWYTGNSNAVDIAGNYTHFTFGHINAASATAQNGIRILGLGVSRITGTEVGNLSGGANYFHNACVFYDAANSLGNASTNFVSINNLWCTNQTPYGIDLTSASGVLTQDYTWDIPLISEAATAAIRVGNNASYQCHEYHTFNIGPDHGASTGLLADIMDHYNNINFKAWIASIGTNDVVVRATAINTNIEVGAGATTLRVSGTTYILSNHSYIAPGEIRTISGTLAGVTPAGIMTGGSIDNPFGRTVRVVSVDIEITTQGAASGSMCVGIGSSATTDYATIFSVLPTDPGTTYPYLYNSTKTATYGVQTNPINWATGAGNRYLNFYAHVANAALVATYTITVMGN